MREIKFRAWDKEEHEMFSDVSIIDDTWDMLNEFLKHKDELVFMQYTGLTDKNGVEIYEGDVIEAYNLNANLGPIVGDVAFENGCFGYWLRIFDGSVFPKKHRGETPIPLTGKREIEVIGNIYEHPHLLEVSTDE